jgi:hypothetical protein
MQDARKPDGTGGPLSENERIDDIQFYADPRAELLIDDIVLYDAAPEKETRPFPKRILFTGWFDSGKQGKEWPGSFEIDQKKGYFWHAAKSVPHPEDKKLAWISLGLRGERPLRGETHLFFRYKLDGADSIQVSIESAGRKSLVSLTDLKKGEWAQKILECYNTVGALPPRDLRQIVFLVPAGATLWIDDLLLYEPGKADTPR